MLPSQRRGAAGLLCTGFLVASGCTAIAPSPLERPQITGEWWTIAHNPDLGRLTGERQEPVDFSIWQASDGTWQLWSCIRNTRCGGKTRLLHRWEGRRLTDSDWRPLGVAMQADPRCGETPGGLQAPFVLRDGRQYLMFYGDWEHICLARSDDGKNFRRWEYPEGQTGMFGEAEDANTRDPMAIRLGSRWLCYYTAHPNEKGADYVRDSTDLRTWSPSRKVASGGQAGTGPYSAECPFVVQRGGWFYLFRTQRYRDNPQTSVYRSQNPYDFGVEDDRGLVGTLPVAAPEIIEHDGQYYIAALLPDLSGIRIARLEWVAAPTPQAAPQSQPARAGSPLDHLPPHIRQLTHFGERADWSHDGKRILFLAKTFGDAYEAEVATGIIRPATHRYFHEGYTRALYLASGDILLSGARDFDAKNPWPSREHAELWVLGKDLSHPPTPLGEKCSEGPAVSRRHMRIAWTMTHAQYPDRLPEGADQIWMADIAYEGSTPKLVNKKKILDARDLPFKAGLETQNFRPPDEKELIFTAYGYQDTEVVGLDLATGKVVNYSNAPGQYDEPEGIFPDGRFTLVECDKHRGGGSQNIDIYKLALDGSGKTERLTFFNDYPGYKASNPVVSDDGRYLAFQFAKVGDPAGVGRGIMIYDFAKR